MRLDKIVALGTLLIASALLVVACSQSSVNPAGPSGLSSANVSALEGGTGSCSDGIDNEKEPDGLIDCKDPECSEDPACKTPPPPVGNCSPGYYKNHRDVFDEFCDEAAALSSSDEFVDCGDLLEAITCNGGPATGCTGPRRQAAATALNTVSGCTE